MNLQRRRALAATGAMLATAAGGGWLDHREPVAAAPIELDELIPQRFGDWRSDPVTAPFVRAADRQGLTTELYDQVFERTFVDEHGRQVMLSIAYGRDQSADLQLHRPEVCYRAGGFSVSGLEPGTLQVGAVALPVRRLMASMPGRPEPITYWMVVGGHVAPTAPKAWPDRLRSALKRRAADALLVRVSSINAVPGEAYRLQADFAAELLRSLPVAARARIMGLPVTGLGAIPAL